MDLLFEKSFNFDRQDYKTHVMIPFFIKKDYQKLCVDFEYSPKTVEDKDLSLQIIDETLHRYLQEAQAAKEDPRKFLPVTNLLTLSLDCGDDYIGAAHRPSPSQRIEISAKGSSPGFIPYSAMAGSWSATISIHAISVPVTCSIRIIGEN